MFPFDFTKLRVLSREFAETNLLAVRHFRKALALLNMPNCRACEFGCGSETLLSRVPLLRLLH